MSNENEKTVIAENDNDTVTFVIEQKAKVSRSQLLASLAKLMKLSTNGQVLKSEIKADILTQLAENDNCVDKLITFEQYCSNFNLTTDSGHFISPIISNFWPIEKPEKTDKK